MLRPTKPIEVYIHQVMQGWAVPGLTTKNKVLEIEWAKRRWQPTPPSFAPHPSMLPIPPTPSPTAARPHPNPHPPQGTTAYQGRREGKAYGACQEHSAVFHTCACAMAHAALIQGYYISRYTCPTDNVQTYRMSSSSLTIVHTYMLAYMNVRCLCVCWC